MPGTAEQRDAARAKANAARQRNAELKRELKSGTLSIKEALEEPDLASWTAADVVGFAAIGRANYQGARTPKRAPKQALAILHACRIPHTRRVIDLTPLERTMLLAETRKLEAKRTDTRNHRHGVPSFLR